MLVTYLKNEEWRDQDLGGKRPDKSVCIVRYGGFGDMIQMSSVLPYLKKNGWYITVNTSDSGYKIIKHDPHIDEVVLQHKAQVPNKELSEYWGKLAENFTRFVQLSESIEGTLLALPGREQYAWPTKKRHQKMNKDYFKQMHDISKVPLPPRPKFYPSEKEEKKAAFLRNRMGNSFTIMWTLAGSSVHKAYPHMDSVIAALLLEQDVKIVFVGDELCQLLEDPWKNEKRVIRKSGRMNIRDTLALAQKMDMVIGQETGVLNCVAFEPIPKIIFLSHSSPVNFGGKWENTTTLTPKGVDCYPCHKMHYGWKTCNRDEETGAAMCQANISPDRVYNAIVKFMKERKAA